MSRIFISYKRVDKTRVFEIKHLIESHIGDKCWIDLDGIESDAQFKNVIIKAINRCEVVLFMYSKAHTKIHDFEKDWTVRELNFASSKNKRIVFINIDGTPLTDEFSFDYGVKQQVDGRSSESLTRLIRDLNKWINIPIGGNGFEEDQLETTDDINPSDTHYTTQKHKDNHFKRFVRNAFSPGNINLTLFCLLFALTGGIGLTLYPLILIVYYERRRHKGQNTPSFYTRYRKAIISIISILYSILLIVGTYFVYDNYYVYDSYYNDSIQSDNNNGKEQIEAEPEENANELYDKGYELYLSEDYQNAFHYFREAAEQGHADAQGYIGYMYKEGQGVPQDYTEAVKWYRNAAEQGNAYAQNNLGVCYDNGQGVPQDYTEAVKWYRKAAEQGNAYAQYNLGVCYDNGQGVPQDYAEAVKWYRNAAAQGYAAAQYYLGVCYYNGRGVPRDYTKAEMWFELAAQQGVKEAKEWLKKPVQ